jgi:hypothetical protein
MLGLQLFLNADTPTKLTVDEHNRAMIPLVAAGQIIMHALLIFHVLMIVYVLASPILSRLVRFYMPT